MNIAIVLNTRPHEGGITTNANDFSSALRKKGHRVDILSIFGKSNTRKTHKELTKFMDTLLRNRPWMTFLFYHLSLYILSKVVKKASNSCTYDIFWAMDTSSFHVAKKFSLSGKNKVLLWVGASITQDLIVQSKIKDKGWFYRFFIGEERSAYRNAELTICNSIWMHDFIKRICPEAIVSEPIYNPVNMELFKPDYESGQKWIHEKGIPSDKMIILFPSRLEWRKGPHIAVKCLQILVHRFALPVILIMLGDGPEKRTVRKVVEKEGLEEHFRLFSPLPHNELCRAYNAAKVVILPSLRTAKAEESMSNSMLEAMACGVPVVCSAIGGQRSFIQSGENGILVAENDAEEFARAIRSILIDYKYSMMLSESGKAKIQSCCSIETVISKLDSYFQN